MTTPIADSKKRVCIVGAGASGMAAAYALSKHPEKYQVTVFDKEDNPGGMATSIDIDSEKFGAPYINDGVQGCSPAFANTIRMFRMLGYEPTQVGMQISFGKDKDFWSNVFPTELTTQFQKDIVKFGTALKIIKKLEVVFALIPVHVMLRIFRFSKDFGEKMVYPLVALFFGTGNQTPYISSAILVGFYPLHFNIHTDYYGPQERVFMDSSMRLFEYSKKSLLASIPTMYAFPKLHDVYQAWMTNILTSGSVNFKLQHTVTRVVTRESKQAGVVHIEYRTSKGSNDTIHTDVFDELILAVDADSALRLLGQQASWMERRVLGSVKYLHDVTITHNDIEYMKKHYEVTYNPAYNASLPPEAPAQEQDEAKEAFSFAEKHFRPLYYTKQYPEDKTKIEMSFDLTHYQPQFRGEKPEGPINLKGTSNREHEVDDIGEGQAGVSARTGRDAEGTAEPPLNAHVFQTIFLDRDGSQHLWTWDEIPEDKRVYEKWWKQQSHRWQHYARVVPFMMFINGKHHTHFAGAWSVLNMHELAVTSGFAAAYRLGADFPFKGDSDCERLFKLYLGLSHGVRLRREDRQGTLG
ncbi:FAD/NAD-P-binding domain-containing protein [Cristinia sonorae]|uniref:FAD/NAD-P-binding domain-containing protein n=1 Tax=Cristinia sonorae TaxID=1940300 RepID=A0A8K0XUY5_9AGAR|nr:FAD/NAD-P-binding domain-containing protein [Cristinia sonorae]